MRAAARPLSRPESGAVPRSRTSGAARPESSGHLRLCALPSAPFWARQYTRLFLAHCTGISGDTIETAQLIVSELVTNAARASASTLGIIGLSLRPIKNKLVIEVRDQSAEPPALAPADRDAESGRGLMLVDALSEEWGYSAEPHGKVVYATLPLTLCPTAEKIRDRTTLFGGFLSDVTSDEVRSPAAGEEGTPHRAGLSSRR